MSDHLNVNEFLKYYHYYHPYGYFFGGHTHTAWEINVVKKGTLKITYDDRAITLKKNMLLICESEVFHRSMVLSSNGVELFVYQFLKDDISARKQARVYHLDSNNFALVNLIEEEAEKNASKLENQTLFTDKFNYQAQKLLEILLIRLIDIENTDGDEKNPDEILYKMTIDYMKENIDRSIHVDEIAQHCHISPTKLKNVFNKYTSNSIMNYFSNMKINVAKRLLSEGMSVAEVAEKLGFSSQSYFSMKFKKGVGISPSKYKKSKY